MKAASFTFLEMEVLLLSQNKAQRGEVICPRSPGDLGSPESLISVVPTGSCSLCLRQEDRGVCCPGSAVTLARTWAKASDLFQGGASQQLSECNNLSSLPARPGELEVEVLRPTPSVAGLLSLCQSLSAKLGEKGPPGKIHVCASLSQV